MTEEEIKKLQDDLLAAQTEAEKQRSITKEVIATRDELKKKVGEVETKLTGYEEVITKTTGELEAEKNKRAEVATIHTMMVKTSALRSQLEKEGVVAMDTALKLVTMDDIQVDDAFTINSDTVSAVVAKLKETDAILFNSRTVEPTDIPKPKRASEGEPKAGFAEELKNCKKASEVEALLRKHGKM